MYRYASFDLHITKSLSKSQQASQSIQRFLFEVSPKARLAWCHLVACWVYTFGFSFTGSRQWKGLVFAFGYCHASVVWSALDELPELGVVYHKRQTYTRACFSKAILDRPRPCRIDYVCNILNIQFTISNVIR